MPVATDQRPDELNDEHTPGGSNDELQNLENMFAAPSYTDPKELADQYSLPSARNNDLPEGHPDRTGNNDGLPRGGDPISPSALGAAEGGARLGDGQSSAALPKEDAPGGMNYTGPGLGGAAGAGPSRPILGYIQQHKKGSAGVVTGAVVAFIFFGLFGGSAEIIGMRAELLDNSPVGQTTQFALQKRRVSVFSKLVQKSGGYAAKKQLDAVKLEKKLSDAGFKAEKDSTGAITKITENGEDIESIAAHGGDDALKLTQDLNAVVPAADDLYNGPATRNLISERFKGLISWLKGPPKEGQSATEAVDDQLDEADKTAAQDAAKKEAGKSADELAKELSDEEKKAGTKVEDATGGIADDAAAKAGKAEQAVAEQSAAALSDEVVKIGEASGGKIGVSEVTDKLLPALVEKSPGIFTKVATGAAKGISITEPIRVGCTVRGTINFFASIRNVIIAGLVAEGFVRFLTASDETKAGIIRASALNVFMVALNSNGGYFASGAFQSVIGNAASSPSPAENALYSGARAASGFLGVLSNIVNQVPGINNPKNCRFAHNGLVVVGSAIVGAVVGIFSDGASVEATGSLSVALTVVQVALTTIGVPLFASYMKGQVSAAFKSNSNWGGTLAAGSSSFQGALGGKNAFGLATQSQVSQIQGEERVALQYKNSKTSAYDRYFNIARADSLVGRLAFRAPRTPLALEKSLTHLTTSAVGGIASGGGTIMGTVLAGNKALAANTSSCYDDPQLKAHDIAVDALCYPIIVNMPTADPTHAEQMLKQAGEIDPVTGQITSEDYKNYIKNCFSGRPGLLYTENVDKDGKNDPTDNTCVDPGPPIAGDTPQKVINYAVKPVSSMWDKLFGEKAYADTPTTTEVRYGKNQYRQTYYAAMVDMDAMTENINDNFGDAATAAPPAKAESNKVFVLGDSLTVGMNALPGNASLSSQLTTAGWVPTINAQGCRGVYQPAGPIIGDGKSCPKDTIIDGFSAIDAVVNDPDPAKADTLKSAGNIVIALGTNGYETDEVQFKAKATELVQKIRTLNPNAIIYWLNVRLKTNSAKATAYDEAIKEVVAEQGIRLMDWDTYVTTVNSDGDATNDVTWPATDGTHHDTNGYTQKIKYLISGLGTVPSTAATAGAAGSTTTPTKGFPITPINTSGMPCPASPTIQDIPGTNPEGAAYVNGVSYDIHMCSVRGIPVNVIVAKNFDDFLTAFDAAGFTAHGTYAFRTMADQIKGYANGAGKGTYATPGYSNHQYGTAADIVCSAKDGSGKFAPSPTARHQAAFLASLPTYPCLDWIHKNSTRFQFVLQCDGIGKDGEIRASSGGCEWWHLSPNGN